MIPKLKTCHVHIVFMLKVGRGSSYKNIQVLANHGLRCINWLFITIEDHVNHRFKQAQLLFLWDPGWIFPTGFAKKKKKERKKERKKKTSWGEIEYNNPLHCVFVFLLLLFFFVFWYALNSFSPSTKMIIEQQLVMSSKIKESINL